MPMNAGLVGGPPREDLDASTVVRRNPRGEPTAELVPALTIAAHPDPARVGERLVLMDLAAGGEVQISRRSPDFHREGSALDTPLADAFMSRRPIRIASAPARRIRIVSDDGTAVAIGVVERREAELGPLAPGDGVPIALADRILLVLHLVEPGAPTGVDRMGMTGNGLGISRLRHAIEMRS